MKTKILFPVLSTLLLLCGTVNLQAQENREIGVRVLAGRGSDVIFKKEKHPNRFKRFRVGLSNLGYSELGSSGDFVLGVGAGYGREKRKAIKENIHFVTGWELRAGYTSFGDNSQGLVGLGYILGFQYRVNESLSLGAETIPNISSNLGKDGDHAFSIDAGINSTAAISLVYTFQK